jgi:hypothetical protein
LKFFCCSDFIVRSMMPQNNHAIYFIVCRNIGSDGLFKQVPLRQESNDVNSKPYFSPLFWLTYRRQHLCCPIFLFSNIDNIDACSIAHGRWEQQVRWSCKQYMANWKTLGRQVVIIHLLGKFYQINFIVVDEANI